MTGTTTPSLRKKLVRHTWKGYMPVLTDGFSPMHLQSPCQFFIALAQIRRAKLRCTCHGAIFERVLVRRTQEYKSIPRTTSRKSPEIAHVRRHGSLSCMPLFSPPLTSSFVVASAPLKVSLWRRMSAVATIFFILTVALCASDKQHPTP